MSLKKLILVLSVIMLSGCLQIMSANVEGDPLNPTFKFEREILLSTFQIEVYSPAENGKWNEIWGITKKQGEEHLFTKEIKFGLVPPSMEEYIPKKGLKTNSLFKFGFEGGNMRGWGFFAVINDGKELKVVQYNKDQPMEEIISNFESAVESN